MRSLMELFTNAGSQAWTGFKGFINNRPTIQIIVRPQWDWALLIATVFIVGTIIPSNTLMGQIPTSVDEVSSITQLLPISNEPPKVGLPTIEKLPEPKVLKTLTVSATAYNSLPGQTDGDPWTTAAGTRARNGVVAACFPFGTKLQIYLPGQDKPYKNMIYTVEDRTGSGKCNHVDIWMETLPEAKQWGRRTITVKIVEPVQVAAK